MGFVWAGWSGGGQANRIVLSGGGAGSSLAGAGLEKGLEGACRGMCGRCGRKMCVGIVGSYFHCTAKRGERDTRNLASGSGGI